MTNIQNTDSNECFKWCLVGYLHPADHNSTRIRNVNKDFVRVLDFKDIKFSVKIRNIHKSEKKNCINISLFVYENKEKYLIRVIKYFQTSV